MKYLKSNDDIRFELIEIGKNIFILEHCQDHEVGLSNRKQLHKNEGLLFTFPSKEPRIFHMKNCLIPLDILSIENNLVKQVYYNCPPCDGDNCEQYSFEPADFIVELGAGVCKKYNIQPGTKINKL